jgi:hypothetical protein
VKTVRLLILSVLALVACSPADNIAMAQESALIKLWAAVSVEKPAIRLSEAQSLAVNFWIVNDGRTEANPQIEASHLFINGVEPPDWRIVIGNGLRSPSFWALPPGRILQFGYQLGPRYFSRPGIYTLRWEGRNFSSATITFRVLPEGIDY